MSITSFFDEINCPQKSKDIRVTVAKRLKDRFSKVFAGILADIVSGEFLREKTYDDYETDLLDAYMTASDGVADTTDNEFIRHEQKAVKEVLDNIIVICDSQYASEYTTRRISGLPVTKAEIPIEVKETLSSDHALLVAVNESIYINSKGEYDTAVTTKKRYHMWQSMEDERVRPTHIEADGQIREIDKPFNVGASQLMFPGDTSLGADASETINCRCFEVFM